MLNSLAYAVRKRWENLDIISLAESNSHIKKGLEKLSFDLKMYGLARKIFVFFSTHSKSIDMQKNFWYI
jgi:hypothetical protein